MNELLEEIRDQLDSCNLARETRLNLINQHLPNESLLCFLMLSDRFEDIDELASAVINCLKELKHNIDQDGNKLIITHR